MTQKTEREIFRAKLENYVLNKAYSFYKNFGHNHYAPMLVYHDEYVLKAYCEYCGTRLA